MIMGIKMPRRRLVGRNTVLPTQITPSVGNGLSDDRMLKLKILVSPGLSGRIRPSPKHVAHVGTLYTQKQ
jgi:hypothetical protein